MAIVFIGFQQSGKTTLGRYLAHKTQQSFIDLDEHIIKHTPYYSIQEAYLKLGEEQFREHEHQSLRYAQQHDLAIIATGGGSITTHKNRKLIREIGGVIYLKWSFDQLQNKIVKPAYLKTPSLETCFNERVPLYEDLAETTLHLDNHSSIVSVASLILNHHL